MELQNDEVDWKVMYHIQRHLKEGLWGTIHHQGTAGDRPAVSETHTGAPMWSAGYSRCPMYDTSVSY